MSSPQHIPHTLLFAHEKWLHEVHTALLSVHEESYEQILKSPIKTQRIGWYKGSFYMDVNNYLRKKGIPPKTSEIGKADALYHSVINLQTWPLSNGVLYRSLAGDVARQVANMKLGDIWTNAGYSSTAFDPIHSLNFADVGDDRSVLLVISIPKGTPCFYIDGLLDPVCKAMGSRRRNNFTWFYQTEVLLDRGLKLKIDKKERVSSLHQMWKFRRTCRDVPFTSSADITVLYASIVT